MRFLWIVGLVLSLACGQAAAADLIVERAAFEDKSGRMSFEEVQAAPFAPARKVISRGFTRSTLWLRLTVNQPVTDLPLVLTVKPATLGEVTLFSPRPSGLAPAPGIELRPARLWRHEWVDTVPGTQVRYLRIRSASAMLVAAEIATEADAAEAESRRSVLLGLVLGCLLPILMGALVLLVIQREPMVLAGIVSFLTSVLIYALMFAHLDDLAIADGVLGRDGALHLVTTMTTMLSGYLMVYFILCKSHMPRWGHRVTVVFSIAFLALTMASFVEDSLRIRQLAFFVSLAGWIFLAVLSVAAPLKVGARSWFIRVITLAISLASVKTCAQQLGFTEPWDWALDLFAWPILAGPVMFCLIIAMLELDRRARTALAEASEKTARDDAQQAAERRSLQERLVTTLMHEIKTPLSTIQLAAASLHRGPSESLAHGKRLQTIHHSVDDLNALVERYVQVDQLEQYGVHTDTQAFVLTTLLDDVRESLGDDSTVVFGNPGLEVKADYQGARVILLNLLGNARKYSPPGGEVRCEIGLEQRQGRAGAFIRVANEIGLAGAPDPGKAFARYYRSEGARRVSGAGLGLWLSQQTARAMGTEIVCHTDRTQVTFEVWLEGA